MLLKMFNEAPSGLFSQDRTTEKKIKYEKAKKQTILKGNLLIVRLNVSYRYFTIEQCYARNAMSFETSDNT